MIITFHQINLENFPLSKNVTRIIYVLEFLKNNYFNMKNKICLSSNDLDSRLLEIEQCAPKFEQMVLKRDIPSSNTGRMVLIKDAPCIYSYIYSQA